MKSVSNAITTPNALTSNFAPHIHHGISHLIRLQPRLPDHAKHQLRIEPFPGPRGHSLVIEVGGDLAAIHPIILKLQDAVNQGLMSGVKRDQGQRLGLDRNSEIQVVFR